MVCDSFWHSNIIVIGWAIELGVDDRRLVIPLGGTNTRVGTAVVITVSSYNAI